MKKWYITSAIPYVNAKPHLGHALEFVQSDTIARLYRSLGYETVYLSGSDENALKNVQAAEKAGMNIKEFIDTNAEAFVQMAASLNVRFDVFQKGADTIHHFPSSQKLWNVCMKNGDIYKKEYSGLYCVGCETFYTPEELNEKGECLEHPGKPLEMVSEQNYFFRLSAYKERIKELLEQKKVEIIPEMRGSEVISFLQGDVQDISISRSKERARNWGVPVPGDDSQRMYVWFDALNIYQSGIGYGWDDERYDKWWPADMHVIGKGIVRFHAVYWLAFLLSALLSLPKKICVHGYFTVDGQKMSKSLGNVIDPAEVIARFGIDAVRYYLLREIPASSDGDFSFHRMQQLYQSDLANELGNLASRLTTLAQQINLNYNLRTLKIHADVISAVQQYDFISALSHIWDRVKKMNRDINAEKPWELSTDKKIVVLNKWLGELEQIAVDLSPFLPQTSTLLQSALNGKVQKIPPLFPSKK